jgi:hypothetical protein
MVKALMARAMDEINSRPLVSIDYLLEALSIAKQEAPAIHSVDLLKPFCEAVIRSVNIGATNWEKAPIGALFD